jgi:histidinol dehydrogenase
VLQAVKRQGDRAILHYTAEFDQQCMKPEELRVSGSELDAAYQQVSKELLAAIQLACPPD